jgi:prevent-host-death family protein
LTWEGINRRVWAARGGALDNLAPRSARGTDLAKTIIELDDDLLDPINKISAERKTDIGRVVSDIVRQAMASDEGERVGNGVPLAAAATEGKSTVNNGDGQPPSRWGLTMITVTITEAKRDLSRLLKLVEGGEEVIITRHGEAIAKLVAFKQSAARNESIA